MADRIPQDGELNKRVTWIAKQPSAPVAPGRNGQAPPQYQPMGTLWAKVSPIGGDQVVNSDKLQPIRKFEIWARYSTSAVAMKAQDQLVLSGRTLVVNSVRNLDESNFWLIITATETAGATASP